MGGVRPAAGSRALSAMEVIGPRSSEPTIDGWSRYWAANRLLRVRTPALTWPHYRDDSDDGGAGGRAGPMPSSFRWCAAAGGMEHTRPDQRRAGVRWEFGLELASREEVGVWSWSGRARRPGGGGVRRPRRVLRPWWWRAARSGRAAGTSRRIENYLGFPAGITGTELTSRAVTQARKFQARRHTLSGRCRWSRERTAIVVQLWKKDHRGVGAYGMSWRPTPRSPTTGDGPVRATRA